MSVRQQMACALTKLPLSQRLTRWPLPPHTLPSNWSLQQHLLCGISGWRGKKDAGILTHHLVNQLILESCHSFRFYGSGQKRIPIRDYLMPKRILSQLSCVHRPDCAHNVCFCLLNFIVQVSPAQILNKRCPGLLICRTFSVGCE